MAVEWPWYSCVGSGEGIDLAVDQGDIIPGCRVATWFDSETLEGQLDTITGLVMNATCDFAQNKLRSVVVCGVWSLGEVVMQNANLLAAATDACKKHGLPPPPSASDAQFDGRLREIIAKAPKLKDFFNPIIKGEKPGYAMLHEDQAFGFPMSLVSFEHIHTVPLDHIQSVADALKKRLRLRPPYREYVSQAFGRFFTRVGLDVDVPRF